jgi:hypothetical protein
MHAGANQTVNDFLSKSYAKCTVDRYYASADQYTKWALVSGLWVDGLVLLAADQDLMGWV